MPRLTVAATTRGRSTLAALLLCAWQAAFAAPEPDPTRQSELLTNLLQLRNCAMEQPAITHPFRVQAQVWDADCAHGALLLRDDSSVEFIHLDLKGRRFEAGAIVRLEGKECGFKPRGCGFDIVPGMVVDNDGTHPVRLVSGRAVLHAGLNPVRLEYFNGPADLALTLEYEGPDLPRQRVPASVLARAQINPASGATNFASGLDYRCYEGNWGFLPDFATLHPVRIGVTTNFDLGVRTRNENVALEFSGFITAPREGVYTFYLASDDGSRLWIGGGPVEVTEVGRRSPPIPANQVPVTAAERNGRPWVTLQGIVSFVGLRGTGGELQMRTGNDDIRVDIFESGGTLPNLPRRTVVNVSGIYEDVVNEDGSTSPGVMMVPGWNAVRPVPKSETLLTQAIAARESANHPLAEVMSNAAPALVTVAEIKTLPPELAKQEIPVSIRGVLTAIIPQMYGAVLQDSTRGIFVYLQDPQKDALPLQRGDYCQIDGVTGPGLFAPVVAARKITRLGSGQWPQPLRANWDQLVNGSLDTQYAEIDGVVTAVQDARLSLLTEGGKVTLNMIGFRAEALAAYANAVVRIRGCVFAPFNERTHEVLPGALSVGDAAVSILQPPPRHLFDAPHRSIGDLLLYDPEAAPFRRLKVSGQIIHARPGEYFLAEGTNGVRVTTRSADGFSLGDLVDAVGFLGLDAPAAELKEAFIRKTGHARLPAPARLQPDQLLLGSWANTLVQVDATLMSQWREGSQQVLELQSRFLAFRARIDMFPPSLSLPSSGSRLQLTGVYVPLGNRAADGTVSGFELLLHSPLGLRVLAPAPFWTLKLLLVLAGTLAALLCAALVWNKSLHRQVQERSRQLETEIRNREHAEQQQGAEAERARIARDLHDELGAGLTEVSLLASAGLGEVRPAENGSDRFRVIAEKARALVSALDVIVWAIDPRRNSLQSFADYLGSYAEELLSASRIGCRFHIPIECEAVALPGPARHSLFLATKEALNNVVRHAAATEVELNMKQFDHSLEIVIADNGRGFDWNGLRRRNGLLNLQDRLRALSGRCDIESHRGAGTTVRFTVPLPDA